ncbi:hypothetical protein LTR37_007647 [Vermiconidia calcicola]|uniref:Uncharacterized protein n=1 Tax=Vermiconidia calcicola TaxID=1690605 RepID=A0ACC3NFM8_9PEZI|nr:hypothetical protein LTR37_007647 [Vermiconidia calcicola]
MPDKTPISPVKETKPELTLSAASLNNEPVELDGTPTSPEEMRAARRGSRSDTLVEQQSPEERETRERRISERKVDPAVLVDIPKTPGAEEFGKSEDAEATASGGTVGGASS